jgi:hypothetical protein
MVPVRDRQPSEHASLEIKEPAQRALRLTLEVPVFLLVVIIRSTLARPIWILDLPATRGVIWISLARTAWRLALALLIFARTIWATLADAVSVVFLFHLFLPLVGYGSSRRNLRRCDEFPTFSSVNFALAVRRFDS